MELEDIKNVISVLGIPQKNIKIIPELSMNKGTPIRSERHLVEVGGITFSYTEPFSERYVKVTGVSKPLTREIETYEILTPKNKYNKDCNHEIRIYTREGLIWAMLAASGISREEAEKQFAIINAKLINDNIKKASPHASKVHPSLTTNPELSELLLSFDKCIKPYPNFISTNVYTNAFPATYNVSGKVTNTTTGTKMHTLRVTNLQTKSYVEHSYDKDNANYILSYNDENGIKTTIKHSHFANNSSETIIIEIGGCYELEYNIATKTILRLRGFVNHPDLLEKEICSILQRYLEEAHSLASPWEKSMKKHHI